MEAEVEAAVAEASAQVVGSAQAAAAAAVEEAAVAVRRRWYWSSGYPGCSMAPQAQTDRHSDQQANSP